MKGLIIIAVIFAIFATTATPAFSAEILAKGETIAQISKRVGVKANDLAHFNGVRNINRVLYGKTIRFVDGVDLLMAKAWAKRQVRTINSDNDSYRYYGLMIEALENGDVDYRRGGFPSAKIILNFAEAYRSAEE